MAELAKQVLDRFMLAMCTKPNGGMNAFVIEQVVVTKRVGTEVALGGNAFLSPARPFAHAPGNEMLSAESFRVAATNRLCFATGAVFVCYWLENAAVWMEKIGIVSPQVDAKIYASNKCKAVRAQQL